MRAALLARQLFSKRLASPSTRPFLGTQNSESRNAMSVCRVSRVVWCAGMQQSVPARPSLFSSGEYNLASEIASLRSELKEEFEIREAEVKNVSPTASLLYDLR
jgi:hypothetical protein